MAFTKFVAAAGLAVTLAGPALASDGRASLNRDVERELRAYGFQNVDSSSLSSSQVAQIRHLLYSGKGVGTIRGQIGAILNGGLLKTLFK